MPGAIDTWLRGVCGPGCRADLERAVPTALDDAVAAADVYVGRELPAVQARSFTEEDAHRVTQPALAVLGEESAAVFRDRRELLLAWLPDAEPFDPRGRITSSTSSVPESSREPWPTSSRATRSGRPPDDA